MSEIKKMYKNAGIPKYGKRQCKDSEYLECQNYCFCGTDNKCDKFAIEYPPFTAEKQLKLIVLLANREIRISPAYMCSGYRLNNIDNKVACSRNISTFESSLAQHINAIWQNLTEEEKQQVKGILE